MPLIAGFGMLIHTKSRRTLVLYRILHHFQQLDPLAHEILVLSLGDMRVLVTLTLIAGFPLCGSQSLLLALNLSHLPME